MRERRERGENGDSVWRGAAFVPMKPTREIYPSTSAASNRVKEAAPANEPGEWLLPTASVGEGY